MEPTTRDKVYNHLLSYTTVVLKLLEGKDGAEAKIALQRLTESFEVATSDYAMLATLNFGPLVEYLKPIIESTGDEDKVSEIDFPKVANRIKIGILDTTDVEALLAKMKHDFVVPEEERHEDRGGGDDDVKVDVMRVIDMYNTSLAKALALTDAEWLELKRDVDYEKFNRLKLLEKVYGLSLTSDAICKIASTVALRGPAKAAKIKIVSLGNRSMADLGITNKKNPGADDLTPARFLSLFPGHAAVGLKKMKAPKRVQDSELPAHFQFVAAASLPLTPEERVLHRDFAEKFSTLIKGKFNVDIYNSISTNIVEVPPTFMSSLRGL